MGVPGCPSYEAQCIMDQMNIDKTVLLSLFRQKMIPPPPSPPSYSGPDAAAVASAAATLTSSSDMSSSSSSSSAEDRVRDIASRIFGIQQHQYQPQDQQQQEQSGRQVSVVADFSVRDLGRVVDKLCENMQRELVLFEWQLPLLNPTQWKDLGAPMGLAVAIQHRYLPKRTFPNDDDDDDDAQETVRHAAAKTTYATAVVAIDDVIQEIPSRSNDDEIDNNRSDQMTTEENNTTDHPTTIQEVEQETCAEDDSAKSASPVVGSIIQGRDITEEEYYDVYDDDDSAEAKEIADEDEDGEEATETYSNVINKTTAIASQSIYESLSRNAAVSKEAGPEQESKVIADTVSNSIKEDEDAKPSLSESEPRVDGNDLTPFPAAAAAAEEEEEEEEDAKKDVFRAISCSQDEPDGSSYPDLTIKSVPSSDADDEKSDILTSQETDEGPIKFTMSDIIRLSKYKPKRLSIAENSMDCADPNDQTSDDEEVDDDEEDDDMTAVVSNVDPNRTSIQQQKESTTTANENDASDESSVYAETAHLQHILQLLPDEQHRDVLMQLIIMSNARGQTSRIRVAMDIKDVIETNAEQQNVPKETTEKAIQFVFHLARLKKPVRVIIGKSLFKAMSKLHEQSDPTSSSSSDNDQPSSSSSLVRSTSNGTSHSSSKKKKKNGRRRSSHNRIAAF